MTAGWRYECRVARLLFAEGAFVRRGIALRAGELMVTDLDILALRFAPDLSLRIVVGECKTGAARPVVGPLSKNGWLAILGGAVLLTMVCGVIGQGPFSIFALAAIAAAAVYLLDVRPALREATDGSGNW